MTLGPLGPLLGDDACVHEGVTYYRGIESVYGVCPSCRGHFWYAEVPAGAEIVEFDWDEDEETDA